MKIQGAKMTIRQAEHQDIIAILKVIEEAKEALRKAGINQWQDGYPNKAVIEADIAAHTSYVLEKDGEIVATAMLSFDNEPNYETLYEGEWLNTGKHGVIHRVAVRTAYKGMGIADALINAFEQISQQQGATSIKIDTHQQNKRMQRFLEKQGFVYCGIIYLPDGSPRVAFEKMIGMNKCQ